MGYTLPDGTQIIWKVDFGRRGPSSLDVYDTALYDASTYDGGGFVFYQTIPEALILSMRVKQGKDSFGRRYRAGSAVMTLDNSDGLLTPNGGPVQPGDYLRIVVNLLPPAGPPDEPIPDGTTWDDETGREWTSHGALILADDTPNISVDYPIFYGRVDNGIDTVLNGRDVTKITAYDAFAELAPINKDAVPAVGAGENASQRLIRIAADVAGGQVLAGVAVGVSQATMQATTLAQGALDLMHITMDSEGGDLIASNTHAAGSGKAIVNGYGRDWLTTQERSTTVQWVLGGLGLTITDANVTREQQLIVNDATFSNAGGVSQNSQDATSIQRYGDRTFRRLDLIAEDDSQAAFLASRAVANLKQLRPRIREATVPVLDDASSRFGSEVQFGDLIITTVSSINGWSYTAAAHVIGKRYEIFEQTWNTVVILDDAFVDNVNGPYNELQFSNAFHLGGTE